MDRGSDHWTWSVNARIPSCSAMVAILESTPPVTEALYVRCYGKGSSLGSGIPEGDWFCERCKEGQQNAVLLTIPPSLRRSAFSAGKRAER